MAPTPKFANDKKFIRSEISMGKIAEVCMIGREQVKTILQSLSSQIVSISHTINISGVNCEAGLHSPSRPPTERVLPLKDPCVFSVAKWSIC